MLAAVDSLSAARRSNGVAVLERLVRLQKEILRDNPLPPGAVGSGRGFGSGIGSGIGSGCGAAEEVSGERVMWTLCRVLLLRLKDEELTMRCRSSELLAYAAPPLVLPPLCR